MSRVLIVFLKFVAALTFINAFDSVSAQSTVAIGVEDNFDWSSISRFRQECDQGQGESCHKLSTFYYIGQGVVADTPLSFVFLEKACAGGVIDDCMELGSMYAVGRWGTFKPNTPLSIPYFRKACDSGRLAGCQQLSAMFKEGRGVASDPAEASKADMEANKIESKAFGDAVDECGKDSGPSCLSAASSLSASKVVAPDLARAQQLYSKALSLLKNDCEADASKNCALYARMYLFGQGVKKDYDEFTRLLTKACDAGDHDECLTLASISTEPFFKQIEFYQKACDQYYVAVCHSLGNNFNKGVGVKKDKIRAKKLFKQGCDRGHVASCYSYGLALSDAKDPNRDPALAKEYLSKVCDLGIQDACKEIAKLDKYKAKP
jgi:TPR repeat protein